jgi:hypothetical protein
MDQKQHLQPQKKSKQEIEASYSSSPIYKNFIHSIKSKKQGNYIYIRLSNIIYREQKTKT